MSDLKLLDETLCVYGADTSRWPHGRAAALADVMREDMGRSLLAEASALDTMLDRRNVADAAADNIARDDDLFASIMAATVDAEEPQFRDAGVPAAAGGMRRPARRPFQRGLIAGGVMAASLLLGVFAGLNGTGVAVTQSGLTFAQNADVEAIDEVSFAELAPLTEFDLGTEFENEDDIL